MDAALNEAPADTTAFYDFCEALLRLEWPGRRVAVTPAPFIDAIQEACDAIGVQIDGRGVVDVSVGPGSRDVVSAFVCFRVTVRDHVARRDWPAMAALILERARQDFARWPVAINGSPPP